MLFSNLFLIIALTNTSAYGQQILHTQQHMPPSLSTSAKLHSIEIVSPTNGQQLQIGKDLTVSGTSIASDVISNCHVSVIVNGAKPYQLATADGPGGAADYSKWKFVLASKYATIKQGPNNKITAKHTCSNKLNSASFYSINVTGVSATTISKHNQQGQHVTKDNNSSTTNNVNTMQSKISLIATGNKDTIRNNTTSIAASTSTILGLIYIGSSKLHSEDDAKSTAQDTPFVLPFP
jgi:hypothetical protein